MENTAHAAPAYFNFMNVSFSFYVAMNDRIGVNDDGVMHHDFFRCSSLRQCPARGCPDEAGNPMCGVHILCACFMS
jgi:hypothetical protein